MGKQPRVTNPNVLSEAVAQAVRREMKLAGLSQARLADKASISTGQLSDIFTGKKQLTVEEFDRLCFVIGVKMSTVIKEADEATMDRHLADSK